MFPLNTLMSVYTHAHKRSTFSLLQIILRLYSVWIIPVHRALCCCSHLNYLNQTLVLCARSSLNYVFSPILSSSSNPTNSHAIQVTPEISPFGVYVCIQVQRKWTRGSTRGEKDTGDKGTNVEKHIRFRL